MKKVYVIEDQTLLKDLIARLIDDNGMLKLIGSSKDGQEGLKACLDEKPDLVILDIMLPSLNGLEIVKRLKKEMPEISILTFSGTPSKNMIKDLVRAGINGFVEKTAELDELEKAIDMAANGQTYFSQHIIDTLRDIMMFPDHGDSLEVLSNREKEILQLIAEGFHNKEIGLKLGISHKTVDTHRTNIMEKLEIKNVVGLTRFAIKKGLTDVSVSPNLNN